MLFGSDEGVHVKMAKLQIYSRALNEAEMKVAMDNHNVTIIAGDECHPRPHLFQLITSTGNVPPSTLSSVITQSPIACAHQCRQNKKCFIVSYEQETKRCQEFTEIDLSNIELESNPLFYKGVE